MKKVLVSFIAFVLLNSTLAFAIVPFSSSYLSSYDIYLEDKGNGTVQIWCEVTGSSVMDEIGVHKIELREKEGQSWRLVATYEYTELENSGMIKYGKNRYVDYVEYKGIVGKEYYATATVWAGKNGSGDSREVDSRTIILE